MNIGERRAYNRGYNRAHKRSWAAMEIERAAAKGWREKARAGIKGDEWRYDHCRFWQRGGTTTWGICFQPWEASPGGIGIIWAEGDSDPNLVSHENFACINWLEARPGVE